MDGSDARRAKGGKLGAFGFLLRRAQEFFTRGNGQAGPHHNGAGLGLDDSMAKFRGTIPNALRLGATARFYAYPGFPA